MNTPMMDEASQFSARRSHLPLPLLSFPLLPST